jgi:hypothetical protein
LASCFSARVKPSKCAFMTSETVFDALLTLVLLPGSVFADLLNELTTLSHMESMSLLKRNFQFRVDSDANLKNSFL